jgi:replicative DNA helicase
MNGMFTADVPAPPNSIDAEQGLLGAVLFDNLALERLPDSFRAEYFYEPFHARLFAAMEASIRGGRLGDPISMMEHFRNDPAFDELGGVRYLADLVDRAPPASHALEYALIIDDLFMRRELIRVAGEIDAAATADAPAREGLEAAEAQLFSLGERGETQQGFVAFSDALHGAVAMAAEAYGRDGGLSGIATGLLDLDQKLGGLHPSDMLIIAGRPSAGKTALACNIAFNVAKNYAFTLQPDGTRKTTAGGIVGFFSLEMSAEQLAMRLLAEVSGVSSDRIRRGDIQAHEFALVRDASQEIAAAPLHIDATGGLSIAKLSARARRLKRRGGLDLIVVDYLQLCTVGGPSRTDNRVQEVSAITQGLKALAKELGVPVIALSQLSRQVETREDKRPMLSDLRESGSIEQDADVVMFVYREEYYLSRTEPKEGTTEHLSWQEKMSAAQGVAELIIGKQRHGPIGTVKLHFNADLTKFGNLAREGRYAPTHVRQPYGDA